MDSQVVNGYHDKHKQKQVSYKCNKSTFILLTKWNINQKFMSVLHCFLKVRILL